MSQAKGIAGYGAPGPTDGMNIGGTNYSKADLQKFFADGGDPNQWAQQHGIVGARATIQRKGMEKPVVEEAYLQEYDTGQFLWGTHKETMIRKVAESK